MNSLGTHLDVYINNLKFDFIFNILDIKSSVNSVSQKRRNWAEKHESVKEDDAAKDDDAEDYSSHQRNDHIKDNMSKSKKVTQRKPVVKVNQEKILKDG